MRLFVADGAVLVVARNQECGQGGNDADGAERRESVAVAVSRGQALGSVCAPTMLAISAAPIAPPTLRMFAFMPFATPVWCAGTAATITVDMIANGAPKLTPMIAIATRICHCWLCANAGIAKDPLPETVPPLHAAPEPEPG